MMTTQAKAQNEMQIAQLKAGVDASLKHQELQAEIALEPLKMQLHQKAGQGNIPQQKT
jgi:predicted dienelactone hydrolase